MRQGSRTKRPALHVIRGAGKAEKPATGESTNPEPLARGVHRERSSYEGYVGYKAVADGGKLVETAMVARELDTPEWTAWRAEQLWAAIEEYERLQSPIDLEAEDPIAPALALKLEGRGAQHREAGDSSDTRHAG